MIRFLGAITGSALALAALLVLVGVPQFKAQESELDQVLVTLPLRAEPIVEDRRDETDIPANNAAEERIEEVAADDSMSAALPAQIEEPEPVAEPPAGPTEIPEAIPAAQPPTDEPPALQPDSLQWYAFWSPFRSEIAASGFVTQLQRVTGLDYRVVKIKPGVYEVAFAYAEDAEISTNLSQISAATGLDMPGTR